MSVEDIVDWALIGTATAATCLLVASSLRWPRSIVPFLVVMYVVLPCGLLLWPVGVVGVLLNCLLAYNGIRAMSGGEQTGKQHDGQSSHPASTRRPRSRPR